MKVPNPFEEANPGFREMDFGFGILVCHVVNSVTPMMWSEAAVEDKSW